MPQVEIRNYRQGNAEVVLTYPHPNIRIVTTRTTAGVLASGIEYLFTDQLGSIRDVVKGAVRSSVSTYEPFGKPVDVVQPATIAEAHGFIGVALSLITGVVALAGIFPSLLT